MPERIADANLVSSCGLYCGCCKKYLSGACPGCRANAKALYCRTRRCVLRRGIRSCADCDDHPDPATCHKVHGLLFRTIDLLTDTGRLENLDRIEELGHEGYAEAMCREGRQTLPGKWRGGTGR